MHRSKKIIFTNCLICLALLMFYPSLVYCQVSNRVVGQVVDSFGTGIDYVQINAYVAPRKADGSMGWRESTITDSNGRYTFTNTQLDNCAYYFEANSYEDRQGISSPYVNLYYGGDYNTVTTTYFINGNRATALNVCPSTQNLNFTLSYGGSVSGMIYDINGNPINGMRVKASAVLAYIGTTEVTVQNDPLPPDWPTWTDPDGNVFELIPQDSTMANHVYLTDTYSREIYTEFDTVANLVQTLCNFRSGTPDGSYLLQGLAIPEPDTVANVIFSQLLLEVGAEMSRCGIPLNYQQSIMNTSIPLAGTTMSNVDFILQNKCTTGMTKPCITSLPGVCAAGTQICNGTGHWGECIQNNLPSKEVCDGADNNCNNVVDDGCPPCAIIYVPDNFNTIQEAIDAATDGCEIIIRKGTYSENINFKGKAITVKSENGPDVTIIDANHSGSVVTFSSGENSDSILDGFKLTNGIGTYIGNSTFGGGGIYCDNSSPMITNCIINGNYANRGGGIYCYSSSPLNSPSIVNCIISNNLASSGGGIYCGLQSSPSITNCIINDNVSSWRGGGIYCYWHANPSISHCTITGNSASQYGGGIASHDYSFPTVASSILWGNTAIGNSHEIYGNLRINYSNISGGWAGNDNINENPLFVDPGNGDYHLAANSPCIDSRTSGGGPSNDIDGDNRPQGGGYDMGADEYISSCTTDASCNDGLFCTDNDVCLGGICGGQAKSCDDGVVCTDDSCDEGNDQCVNTANDANCDDGLGCTIDICVFDSGCANHMIPDCSSFSAFTDVGSTVQVFNLVDDGFEVTFCQVDNAGDTTVTSWLDNGAVGPPPPADFNLAGDYFDITTEADISGCVAVCIPYDNTGLAPGDELSLLHYNENVDNWEDATDPDLIDTVNYIICGEVTSLSTFIPASTSNTNPDVDGDGFGRNDECDDNDKNINPNATEVCDGVDNNCDGQTDEGCPSPSPDTQALGGGGGGGCSLAPTDQKMSTGSAMANALTFFLPLIIFGIRRKRSTINRKEL